MVDAVLEAARKLEAIIEEGKAKIEGGVHLQLCAAVVKVYNAAKALNGEESEKDDEEEGEVDEEEGGSESEEPERERTEDDMSVNELAELWECQFDFGLPNAVLELEGLIWNIVEDTEAKRVCAAVRVLNRALRGSKRDDPADAERILEWKEDLIAERAIRVCAEILEKVDDRGFHNENHDEYWMYSIICDEILELFQGLGQGDALFRTKLRRDGALKGVEVHAKEHPNHGEAQELLCTLRQR